jgi:two-component system response regulator AtoC
MPFYGISMAKEILVVEDDEGVRRMLAVALPFQGFVARLTAGGAEAVEVYRQNPDGFAAVLLDVQMEGMDGAQTLASLRAINPGVRCCMMSGHTGRYAAEELRAMGATRFLQKPFTLSELTQILQELSQETSTENPTG